MEQSSTITANEKMSEAEIQQAIRDAGMYASQDGIRRGIMDTTNEAQRSLAQVEQAMSKAGKQIEKEEKKRIKADQATLNKFMIKNKPDKMSEGDLMNLKAVIENLRMRSQHLLDMAQSAKGTPAAECIGRGSCYSAVAFFNRLCFSGSTTQKVVPSPTLLRTRILPPWAMMMMRAMDSPRP